MKPDRIQIGYLPDPVQIGQGSPLEKKPSTEFERTIRLVLENYKFKDFGYNSNLSTFTKEVNLLSEQTYSPESPLGEYREEGIAWVFSKLESIERDNKDKKEYIHKWLETINFIYLIAVVSGIIFYKSMYLGGLIGWILTHMVLRGFVWGHRKFWLNRLGKHINLIGQNLTLREYEGYRLEDSRPETEPTPKLLGGAKDPKRSQRRRPVRNKPSQ